MKKTVWIEYTKTIAAFLIVLQHSISQEWVSLLGKSAQWPVLNLLFMLTRTGVPLFLMCSGMGMLSRERSIKDIFLKNIRKIMQAYAGWMLFYGIFDAYSLWQSAPSSPPELLSTYS